MAFTGHWITKSLIFFLFLRKFDTLSPPLLKAPEKMVTIDVIVPSFRLQSQYLIPILQMSVPPETSVRFLIIADNPGVEIPKDMEPFMDNEKVILVRNPENLGVCKTRNIGIEKTSGDWILFLDDDITPSKNLLITYSKAIREHPGETGFFGDVVFPKPVNSFTNGIKDSGILTLFSVPGGDNTRKWAPTANVLIKRSAVGDVRFNEVFAKAGAAEEIDFFLKIYRNTHRELQGITNAEVYHGWWYNGKRIYTRFIRWNTGIALLTGIFPEYSYYTFPNVVESLALGIPLTLIICLFLHSFLPLFCILPGILAGECLIEFLRLLKSKGFSQSKFVIDVVLIRAANDFGRLKKLHAAICRRFNSSGNTKNIASQRFWAGLKFIAYLLLSAGLYIIFRRTA